MAAALQLGAVESGEDIPSWQVLGAYASLAHPSNGPCDICHGRHPCLVWQKPDLSVEGRWLLSHEAPLSPDVMPGLCWRGEMAHALASVGDGTGNSVSASPPKPSFVLGV